MSSRTLVRVVLAATILCGGMAMAQDLRDIGPPAEYPPADYTGNQYVDSRGCVYIRAGIGGNTTWVPRVNREREALCGFEPTLQAMAAAQEAEQQPATAAAPVAIAEAETGPATTPEPASVAAAESAPPEPRPAPVITADADDAVTAPPTGQAAPVALPRIITVPMPAPEPQRRTITRAEACEGRSGVQPNIISSRTGEPIDCGPEPAATSTVAAAASEPGSAQPRQVTRTAICREIAETGRQYIDVATGAPVACPSRAPAVTSQVAAAPQAAGRPGGSLLANISAALVAPRTPYLNPLDRAPGTLAPPPTAVNARSVLTPAPRYTNPLDRAPGSYVSRSSAQTAPYSNPPAVATMTAPQVPAGYEAVWDDGRLNPQRGLPAQQ